MCDALLLCNTPSMSDAPPPLAGPGAGGTSAGGKSESAPGVALSAGQPPAVGQRVAVYWTKQAEWFNGIVRAADKHLGKRGKVGFAIRVEYEDGLTSEHQLGETKMRLLASADAQPSAPNTLPSATQNLLGAAKAQEMAAAQALAAKESAALAAAEATAKAAEKKARVKAARAAKACPALSVRVLCTGGQKASDIHSAGEKSAVLFVAVVAAAAIAAAVATLSRVI